MYISLFPRKVPKVFKNVIVLRNTLLPLKTLYSQVKKCILQLIGSMLLWKKIVNMACCKGKGLCEKCCKGKGPCEK